MGIKYHVMIAVFGVEHIGGLGQGVAVGRRRDVSVETQRQDALRDVAEIHGRRRQRSWRRPAHRSWMPPAAAAAAPAVHRRLQRQPIHISYYYIIISYLFLLFYIYRYYFILY